MAYKGRPGVTVTQAFQAAAPALAAVSLPCVAVGPAYQIVDGDLVGTYSGAQTDYNYDALMPGALVDATLEDPNELFPITKKPVSVELQNTVVEIVATATTGSGNGTAFTDATTSKFLDVLAGDIVVIAEALALTIVAARVDGKSSDTAGNRDRLEATVAGQFANVKVGDTVVVTAGTNAVPGSYTVLVKINSSMLKLDAEVNDGVGPSTNTAYSITGDRGGINAGEYPIMTVTDVNTLVLTSPLPDSPESPLTYMIKRELAAPVTVDRVAIAGPTGFYATDLAIQMPAGYQVTIGANDYDVIGADVYASYRALRTDLYSEVREYSTITDIEAVFGTSGQIVPANPLPFALSIMKQNTVSAVNGLALSADFATDEALAYTKSLDVLLLTEMYAICPLTHLGSVHTAFKNHVEQLSLPEKKRERVAIFNSLLNTIGLVQDAATLSTAVLGARVIVSTQLDGSGAVGTPTILNDATLDQFLNVKKGDVVTVTGGTGVTPGAYTVSSKTSSNILVLSAGFITAGSPTDIEYYISRKDGLDSDGQAFYDRNATFLSNGAAAGHYLEILTGSFAGRYLISAVVSEKEVTLAVAIPGIGNGIYGVDYEVNRDLSKSEQATNIAGYSSSFSSRRCVHTWPDIVKAPVGSVLENIPGYFASSTIAALTTGLPSQQGFTNLTVSGFLGFNHSTKYFNEDQLNTIAGGGTLVFIQEGPDQPLLVRHQLTTDRSQIKFQEYSVTKNVDFIAKFLRDAFAGPIGKYNIVDTTMDYLKTVAQASLSFLKDKTKLNFIGGVIRSGSLKTLQENPDQIDTVDIVFAMQIPIPLNYIDIVIEV